jgi:phage baseplate assembly protein W
LQKNKFKSWSDLNMDFIAHPNSGDLSLKSNDRAIVSSVRNLLLTNHYERPFHPEIGSNLTAQLFELMSPETTLRIKECIIETINNFEPRVDLTAIDVIEREVENGYYISLSFFIINQPQEFKTKLFLERAR